MQDEQFFQENQALPENWDFIASTTNGSTSECIQALATPYDDGAYVQIFSTLGLLGTLHLRKSTVACEYTLQDLKRSISVLCGLPQSQSFDLISNGITIASNSRLNQLIQGSPFVHQGLPIVAMQIHAAASRKVCLMCLKTDCHHQSGSLKRKSCRDTSPQTVNLLEPTAAPKTPRSVPNKKRRTHLTCSSDLTATALGTPLVDSVTI
jgi:hypothetical protein